ncbi:hypothetical protein [Microbacterium sulfonylureivorans]|uniref:hypothetical protein n=1 Tax=Microbacterium sulfonylureivorans TaxID=2486854 RepID=UPI000FD826CE|nr:hypothetical protein [Microbacterium sulfonylureivorans]
MRLLRTTLALTIAIGALALAGCTSDPDLSGLESELAGVDGINGAIADTQHSGAPWNTATVILLFLDDSSDEGIIASVRGAAPVLADDAAVSRNPVSLIFIDGDRDDYDTRSSALADDVIVTSEVADSLGIAAGAGESLRLTPEDLRRLTGE